LSDFEFEEFDLGQLNVGEIVFECQFLSVDPYVRPRSRALQVPCTMIGRYDFITYMEKASI